MCRGTLVSRERFQNIRNCYGFQECSSNYSKLLFTYGFSPKKILVCRGRDVAAYQCTALPSFDRRNKTQNFFLVFLLLDVKVNTNCSEIKLPCFLFPANPAVIEINPSVQFILLPSLQNKWSKINQNLLQKEKSPLSKLKWNWQVLRVFSSRWERFTVVNKWCIKLIINF